MAAGSPGHAIVAGGSIGGLFAATALLRAGWHVSVYERSEVELSGRGAGIVTHDELIAALGAVGADVGDLGVSVQNRVALDLGGNVVETLAYPQVVTSWDRIHTVLRALIPEGHYHRGRAITGYETHDDHAVALLEDGSRLKADVVIGADGFRSAIRGQMCPEVQPVYSGYVVWRAVADEASLPADVHAQVFSDFGLYAPHGTQVVGYPIAGPDNNLTPGQRRYNFVWYRPVPPEALRAMLTDATGRTHGVSIPPPLVRDEVLTQMQQDADRVLPPPYRAILALSERPFFTPIYDHCAAVFAEGRVALSGDAACVARPHVGMGVTKAAQDALALARHLALAPPAAALAAYSAERAPAAQRAHAKARELGRHIFAGTSKDNPDGASNPRLEAILRETAVPVDRTP